MRRNRWNSDAAWSLVLALGAALALVPFVAGCDEAESVTGSAASATAETAMDLDAAGFHVSLQSLPPELDLTDDQRTALGAAIEELDASRAAMRKEWGRKARGRGQDGPGRGPRGGAGRGDGLGLGRRGDFEPPMMTFLATAAGVLDAEQFVLLAEHLAAHRPERAELRDRADRRNERTMRGRDRCATGEPLRGERGPRGADGFDLTRSERGQLRAVLDAHRDALRDLRTAVHEGQIGPHDAVERAEALARGLRSDLVALLGDDRAARWEDLRAERRNDRVEDPPGAIEGRLSRRAELLAAALDLSGEQAAEVERVFHSTLAAREEIWEAVHAGSLDPGVAGFRILEIDAEAAEDVRDSLDPERRALWDRLRAALPGPGRPLF